MTKIFILILGIIALAGFKKWRKPSLKEGLLLSLFLALYGIYALSGLYTDDPERGLAKLGQRLSLLIFPLIFWALPSFERKEVRQIIKAFIGGSVLAVLLMYAGAGWEYWDTHKNAFFYDKLAQQIDAHPTFIGMLILFAYAVLLLDSVKYWQHFYTKIKAFRIALLILLVSCIFLLSARIIILAFGLITIVLMLLFFYQKNKLWQGIGALALQIGIAVLLIMNSSTLSGRFGKLSKSKSANPRIEIWDCATTLIADKPLFGYGIGQVKSLLSECYKAKRLTKFYNKRYDAHNQYLEIWITAGLLGLVILLLNLFVPLGFAWQSSNYAYVCFLIIIMSVFLTESILERQDGIFFYAFFNALFATQFFQNTPTCATSSNSLAVIF